MSEKCNKKGNVCKTKNYNNTYSSLEKNGKIRLRCKRCFQLRELI